MPHILHAVKAKAPRSRAPPTPPTTPPIIFLELELKPELLLLALVPATREPVTRALVVTGTTVLVVLVAVIVCPLLVTVTSVVTCCETLVTKDE